MKNMSILVNYFLIPLIKILLKFIFLICYELHYLLRLEELQYLDFYESLILIVDIAIDYYHNHIINEGGAQ
jgi:hypothetical protein